MGQLVFQAALGGQVNLAGPNTASTTTFTLPSADGSSGQVLKTDGSGVLSWVAQPANDKKTIVLVSGDITNQYVDLDHVAKADRKSTRLNSSHSQQSRMPSSA